MRICFGFLISRNQLACSTTIATSLYYPQHGQCVPAIDQSFRQCLRKYQRVRYLPPLPLICLPHGSGSAAHGGSTSSPFTTLPPTLLNTQWLVVSPREQKRMQHETRRLMEAGRQGRGSGEGMRRSRTAHKEHLLKIGMPADVMLWRWWRGGRLG